MRIVMDLWARRYAIKNEHLVSWLLAHDADPNAGYEYDTPLSRAVLVGSVDIVKPLLSRGGDVRRGQVLHWAVERRENVGEVFIMLLDSGAMPDVVAKLLEYGANPYQQEKSGKTPMAIAVDLGYVTIALLMQGNHARYS